MAVVSIFEAEVGFMGAMANQSRPGFAKHEIPADVYDKPKMLEKYAIDKIHYSEVFRGLLLYSLPLVTNMPLSSVTQLSGIWHEQVDPIKKCLFAVSADAGAPSIAEIFSNADLPANPSLVVTVHRAMAPPAGEDIYNQEWKIKLGGAEYIITWTRFVGPKLTDSTGNVLSSFELQENDRERFATDTYQRWEIAMFGTTMYVSCSGLSDVWKINIPDGIPPGVWAFYSAMGKCAVNVTIPTFENTGSYETPDFAIPKAIPNADFTFRSFPSSIGSNVAVEINDGTDIVLSDSTIVKTKKMKITLTKLSDGSTPLVQSFECTAMPTFNAPYDVWYPITDYIRNASENIGEDTTTRTANINLSLLHRDSYGQTLYMTDAYNQVMRGQYMVKLTTGYQVDNYAPVKYQRMIGIAKAYTNNAGRELSVTIADRWVQLNDYKIRRAPLLHGYTVYEAVSIIAQWCGIAPGDIHLPDPGDSGLSMTIPDPPDGFDKPSWVVADGESGASAIQRLKDAFGIHAEFYADGVLALYRDVDTTTVLKTYGTTPGTLPGDKIGDSWKSGITLSVDLTGAVNSTFVQGETTEGEPIYFEKTDEQSAYGGNFFDSDIGYLVQDCTIDSNLKTEQEVIDKCSNMFNLRHRGGAMLTCVGIRDSDILFRLPGDIIGVYDSLVLVGHTYDGYAVGCIKSLSTQFAVGKSPVSSFVMEIDPLNNGVPPTIPDPDPMMMSYFTIDDGSGVIGSTIDDGTGSIGPDPVAE
jgi:hypothetical protein